MFSLLSLSLSTLSPHCCNHHITTIIIYHYYVFRLMKLIFVSFSQSLECYPCFIGHCVTWYREGQNGDQRGSAQQMDKCYERVAVQMVCFGRKLWAVVVLYSECYLAISNFDGCDWVINEKYTTFVTGWVTRTRQWNLDRSVYTYHCLHLTALFSSSRWCLWAETCTNMSK